MTAVAPATSAASSTASPERAQLHQAAQAFEAIFVREMLAAARQSSFGETPLGNDQGAQTFAAMRDEHFADLAAHSGALGLGQQVERALEARLPVTLAAGSKG